MMAIKGTTTQTIHLQALIKDFGEEQDSPTIVHIDSKAAHDGLLSENFSKPLKYVTVARQWVHEQLESGIIEVKHVCTRSQPADFFTKLLSAHIWRFAVNSLD